MITGYGQHLRWLTPLQLNIARRFYIHCAESKKSFGFCDKNWVGEMLLMSSCKIKLIHGFFR